MSEAIEKIEKYLKETEYRGDYDKGEYDEEVDDFMDYDDIDLMDKMVDFMMTLDPDKLDDGQFELYSEIMDEFDSDEELEVNQDFNEEVEEIDEIKRVKRDRQARREARKDYRKKKVALKQKGKRFRKTAEYKKYQRKKKMMARQGRTARGKKVKKFID
jgi:hypothetical protein